MLIKITDTIWGHLELTSSNEVNEFKLDQLIQTGIPSQGSEAWSSGPLRVQRDPCQILPEDPAEVSIVNWVIIEFKPCLT